MDVHSVSAWSFEVSLSMSTNRTSRALILRQRCEVLSQQQLRNIAPGSLQRAGSMRRSESALTVGRVKVLTLYAELLLFLFTMKSVFYKEVFQGGSRPKSFLPCERKLLRNILSSCRKLKAQLATLRCFGIQGSITGPEISSSSSSSS